MRRRRELLGALALAIATAAGAQTGGGAAKPGGGLLDFGGARSKDPITITSDRLEYEYRDGVIVYRGDVVAVQGQLKIRSNELRITLAASEQRADGGATARPLEEPSASRVQSVVASGGVRIDQGTRWAVGGRATFDQANRTLVLTENPVLHDGPNEVAGDRVVVYLDEDRSVVEGGRKRVKAVLFPGSDGAAPPAKAPEPAR